jgi:hypothetical protein
MPRKHREPRAVTLEFDRKQHKDAKDFHLDISAVTQFGDDLWVGSDELTSVERLSALGNGRFGQHAAFSLADYLDLPAGESEEIDIEGLAVEGHYLWVVGSHSLKREKAAKADSPKKAIKRLSRMVRETNRYLLARIPIVKDPDTGATRLFKTCVDPDHPKRRLTAAQVFGTGRTNMLIDALRDDPHLERFLSVPCKENGLDIEGLAVRGDRIFLGLRGPVLRGWAMVLEVEVEPVSDHLLSLERIGPHGAQYRKHVLDLGGLGVRELCEDGDDVLVLAGPTMDLDGHVVVLRWKNGLVAKKQQIVKRQDLEPVLEFRFDHRQPLGTNHPEGIALFREDGRRRSLLVTYDSPAPAKQRGPSRIQADVFALGG